MLGTNRPHHNSYCSEDEQLTVNNGCIERNKQKANKTDWAAYHKSTACFVTYISLVGVCIAAALIGIVYVLIKADVGSKNHSNQASVANIVPRVPVMQFHSDSFNGTYFSTNGTLSGVSTGVSTSTTVSTYCTEETAYTQLTNQTYAEPMTTIKQTLTKTFTLQQSTRATTVSSALAVPGIQSGASSASQSVGIITEVITASVTKTVVQTGSATVTESTSELAGESTMESASQVQTPSVDFSSVLLTETQTTTLNAPNKATTVEEVVSTVIYTPTSIITSTITVTSEPLTVSSREAQCSLHDHTVYITVTKIVEPSPSVASSPFSIVTTKTKTVSLPSASPARSTDTVVVTYTVTVDSFKPTTKSSPSSDDAVQTTTVTTGVRRTVIVTERATKTVFETVVDGTTATYSTTVSSALPVLTSITSSKATNLLHDTAIITQTVTDMVTETQRTSASSDAKTSHTAVTVTPSTLNPAESIYTTIILTDLVTKTVGGVMTTITVYPSISTPLVNSTATESRAVFTEVEVITMTVTVGGEVKTTIVHVPENTTATTALTETNVITKTVSPPLTDASYLSNNATVQVPAVTINTTIYITGAPIKYTKTDALSQPPFPTANGTVVSSTHPGSGQPVSTAPVFSGADKRAEPIVVFGVLDRGKLNCQTCLIMFILGLMVLF